MEQCHAWRMKGAVTFTGKSAADSCGFEFAKKKTKKEFPFCFTWFCRSVLSLFSQDSSLWFVADGDMNVSRGRPNADVSEGETPAAESTETPVSLARLSGTMWLSVFQSCTPMQAAKALKRCKYSLNNIRYLENDLRSEYHLNSFNPTLLTYLCWWRKCVLMGLRSLSDEISPVDMLTNTTRSDL